MAAGEGIARGLGSRGLHDGEIRILDPGARDAEGQLQKLVEHRTRKAHRQHIAAAGLVEAPEHDDGQRHEHHLAAAVGDQRHDGVQPGHADALQRV